MPIALYATNNALLAHLPDLVENNTDEDMPLAILLTNNSETLAESVASAGLDIVTIPVQSARLGRLNFDMVGLIILDLTPDELLSSSGRRLSEILGRLAEDLLTLVLAGDGVAMTGAFLPDGVTAALNLVPRAVVMPQLQAGDELRALLAQLGEAGLRLLTLDGDAGATYAHIGDRVWAHGTGNVMLIGFHQDADSGLPTARLKLLTDGMQSEWPQ